VIAPLAPEYRELTARASRSMEAGRLDDAGAALREITRLNPREHFAWALLAEIALRRGDAEAAAELVRHALEMDRKNADYLNLLGVAYGELGRYDDALGALRKSLRERPASTEAHYNIGKILEKRRDLAGARDAFARAAAIDPRYPGARYMHARALMQLGAVDAAVRALERALADDPDDPWLVDQYGKALAGMRGQEAAIEWLAATAARLPRSAMVRRSHAVALLAAGRLREGWREYLARGVTGEAPRDELPGPLPRDLSGARVWLRSEQGLGDILFFLRFVPALRERGASVSLLAPRKLLPLLERTVLFAELREDDPAAALPRDADRTLFVGDLPGVLEEDGPRPSVRLEPLPARVAGWRERLAACGPPPYVGVTWRAGTDFRQEREFGRDIRALFKEIDVALLGRTLRDRAGTLVSVQRRPLPGEVGSLAGASGLPVFDAAAMNDDLEEALALLEVLDDYVGVSNTNMHLRVALGKTGKVLVPFPPEWRWLAAGAESPWFPGFGIYRQTPRRSWDAALAGLSMDLDARRPVATRSS
jgi:tetratricopeptide (TPR) repeat protein